MSTHNTEASPGDKYSSDVCSCCGKFGKKLERCGQCMVARYCSRKSQDKDWKTKHRAECKELRRSRKTEEEGEESHGNSTSEV